MDLLGQSALVLAALSLGLSVSVFARNRKSKLHLLYSFWSFTVAGWASAYFLARFLRGERFYLAHLIFNVWMAPACMAFLRSMVRDRGRITGAVLKLVSLLALLLTGAVLGGFSNDAWVKPLILFLPGVIAIQVIGMAVLDFRRYRASGRLKLTAALVGLAPDKRALSYVGAFLILSTSYMDHFPSFGRIIPSIGNVLLTGCLFFLAQAITKQRFLDFESILSRFLVLLGMAVTLTALYSILFTYVENKPALFLLNSFLVSFLILTLLDPLRALVREITRRLLRRRFRKLEELLQEAQSKLVSVVEERTLVDQVSNFVVLVMDPSRSAVFFLDREGTRYRSLRTFTKNPGREIAIQEILPDHPLLAYSVTLAKRGELPILFEPMVAGEAERAASRSTRAWANSLSQGFRAMDANLIVPMIDGGKLLGFIALWMESSPEPWGNDLAFLRFLSPYFDQCARTYSGLEVYVRQREKERLAELGQMAAGLAHEIRNPLGAILGAAELLEVDPSKPEARFVGVIQEEGKRLDRVVREFLDYSRPETQRQKPVDVVEIAKKAIERVEPLVKNLPIEIVFSAPQTAAWTIGNASSLHQVAVNLLHNSVKALEKRGRGGRIDVSVSLAGKGTPRSVRLEIEDNGPGIPREHMEKLFIPFFTTSPSGTGLGLSISQKIVEAHRGRIEVTSEEGKYARFSILLPGAVPE